MFGAPSRKGANTRRGSVSGPVERVEVHGFSNAFRHQFTAHFGGKARLDSRS